MSTNDTSTAGWSDSQAATFAKAAIERAGGKKAWHGYLSQPQREGAIAPDGVLVKQGAELESYTSIVAFAAAYQFYGA